MDCEFSRFQEHTLEKSTLQEKRSRWADASSLIKRSRWDQDRRYIQPGKSNVIILVNRFECGNYIGFNEY